jgi:hypothetical protein
MIMRINEAEVKALKRVLLVGLILGLLCAFFITKTARAQTTTYPVLISDTFEFDGTTAIIAYDGATPANPPNGAQAQFPYHMGGVVLNSVNISGITVPFDLNNSRGYGYLNNGDLRPCDTVTWGPQTWTVGNGTNVGDTYTVSASTTCPYFTGEYGTYENSNNRLDGFSVTATYMLTSFAKICPRGRPCYLKPVYTLQGGIGTITEWDITPH